MTVDNMVELKPCPFCGHSPCSVSDNGRGLVFNVRCGRGSCLATGPLERCAADAISEWNTRSINSTDGPNDNALREALNCAADAWDAHCLAVERCNAAIPALEATRAERQVYDERYRASEQAKRDMYSAAFALAKCASENRAALNPSSDPVGGATRSASVIDDGLLRQTLIEARELTCKAAETGFAKAECMAIYAHNAKITAALANQRSGSNG